MIYKYKNKVECLNTEKDVMNYISYKQKQFAV